MTDGEWDMASIETLREDLDETDYMIAKGLANLESLFSRRLDIGLRIGRSKRKRGMPTIQPERRAEVITRGADLVEINGGNRRIGSVVFTELVIINEEAQEAERAQSPDGTTVIRTTPGTGTTGI